MFLVYGVVRLEGGPGSAYLTPKQTAVLTHVTHRS